MVVKVGSVNNKVVRELAERIERVRMQRRDGDVLLTLAKYNVLLADHLRVLCCADLQPASADNYLKRLTKLVEAGLLERSYFERRGYCYWLGEWGRVWVAEMLGRAPVARVGLQAHNLLLADFMVAAVREVRVAGGEATWEAEWEQIYGAKTRPDGVLKVSLAGHETNWLVEADTGSETLAQVVRKLQGQAQYYQKGEWQAWFGSDNFPNTLLITSAGERRLLHLKRAIESKIESVEVPVNWALTTKARLAKVTNIANRPELGPLQQEVWSWVGETDLDSLNLGSWDDEEDEEN